MPVLAAASTDTRRSGAVSSVGSGGHERVLGTLASLLREICIFILGALLMKTVKEATRLAIWTAGWYCITALFAAVAIVFEGDAKRTVRKLKTVVGIGGRARAITGVETRSRSLRAGPGQGDLVGAALDPARR
jgi:hypothetical protein